MTTEASHLCLDQLQDKRFYRKERDCCYAVFLFAPLSLHPLQGVGGGNAPLIYHSSVLTM